MTRKYQRKKPTKFEQKWGIHAVELAKQEGVTPDAIHSRVYLWGNPFQRRNKPTICEIMYGKTTIELAHELDIHPVTIWERLRQFGEVVEPAYKDGRGKARLHKTYGNTDWKDDPRWQKSRSWLHPNHPEYRTWRYNYIRNNFGATDE